MKLKNEMLQESGLVTRIENNIAWINTQAKLACSSCQVESTCGNGVLEKYLAGKIFISKLENTLDANVGDQVVISIPKARVTKASIIVYMIPLCALIIGAFIGNYWSEALSILFSGIGFALGLLIIRLYNYQISKDKNYTPFMLSKIKSNKPYPQLDKVKIVNID
ncbi:SoxR reducing system RseC family protein [Aliikangiella sp. IMCC44359]|uniref:SoxR reducing system RseC family protein n=1 Tax=Aliikangiella sp. IMCC44359 TaxID=3459125 RepID=UPI00403AEBE7